MNLYQKRSEYNQALEMAKQCDVEIKEAEDKIKQLNQNKQDILIDADKIESDLTVILGKFQSSKNPWNTINVCYDADLGRIRQTITDTWNERGEENVPILPDTFIDLSKFFRRCDDGFRFHRLTRDLSVYNIRASILDSIIKDMMLKKEYQSWDEIKEDLKMIEELYSYPLENETSYAYVKRVISTK